MVSSLRGNSGIKRVLVINAVCWSESYPADSPHRDVERWYRRLLDPIPKIRLEMVPAGDDTTRAIRRRADAVIMSGSPWDAWSDDPMNEKLAEAIHECKDLGLPFLGICYGHQLMARALGGEVGPHPKGMELGNVDLQLTSAGQTSPLFRDFPTRFDALLSHADAVLRMPADCELLAEGEFTRIQAFESGGHLFGVQFHPELDPDILRFIWDQRRDRWRDKVCFDLDRVLDELRPTPLVSNVLRNFAVHCIP